MRWVEFPDGTKYTFAADIQKAAEKSGYSVPCEADGTRHPGTDCNSKMRTVIKDIGMRRTFKITDDSVVDIKADDCAENSKFIQWLVEECFVSDYYSRLGVVQLYSPSAVDALLSAMLKSEAHYDSAGDPHWRASALVIKRSHNFELKKNKPKTSLFKK